jgi:hypothetical protein
MTSNEYSENEVESTTIKNILRYLRTQYEVNLHRIEGALMMLGFLPGAMPGEAQKGDEIAGQLAYVATALHLDTV